MKLKEQIKNTGLTLTKVAELIPLHPVNLSYYLNGTKSMPLHIEDRIKEIIKIYSNVKV